MKRQVEGSCTWHGAGTALRAEVGNLLLKIDVILRISTVDCQISVDPTFGKRLAGRKNLAIKRRVEAIENMDCIRYRIMRDCIMTFNVVATA